MSIFSTLVKPYRKGEKNFDRGRRAEFRRDFKAAKAFFEKAATAWDDHLETKTAKGQDIRPAHCVMAGICYARIGRFDDALRVLDQCVKHKDIPDAWLHAGYCAAKLGDADKAIAYWKQYPAWAGQRVIANTLKKQLTNLESHGQPALQSACEAVAEAVFQQDRENHRNAKVGPHQYKKAIPVNRGY